MPVVAVMAVASVAMQGASMIEQNQASKQAQGLNNAVAQHNAAVDMANAKQLDLDTVANVRAERAEDKVYLSRQASAYASSGVLTSGSPLSVMATTAGRLEQRVQQQWVNSNRKQEQMASDAVMGQLYAAAENQGLREQNFASELSGGAKLLSTAAGDYQSGAFSGIGLPAPK